MKQGNGTELPGFGTDDPRGESIGVIYVSPNDDRKSVLAALLTQEKLGRKQVAVVLPGQNKAFQRPQDFDDLKSFRRRFQAEIKFIVPAGMTPNLADAARHRRFHVYSSLESFANALQDDGSTSTTNEPKRRLFGSPKQKAAAIGAGAGAVAGITAAEVADAAANKRAARVPQAPQTPTSQGTLSVPRSPRVSQSLQPAQPLQSRWPSHNEYDEDEYDDEDDFGDEDDLDEERTLTPRNNGSLLGAGAMGVAAGAGAGLLAADLAHHAQGDELDDEDALPPVQSAQSTARATRTNPPNTPYGEGSGATSIMPPSTPRSRPLAGGTPSRTFGASRPVPPPLDDEYEDEDEDEDDFAEGAPGIIELPRREGERSTVKLPDRSGEPMLTAMPLSSADAPPTRGAPRRNSGATAGAGAALLGGVALGAAGANAANARGPRVAGGSVPPTRGGPSGNRGRGTPPPRRRRNLLWIALLLLLLLAILSGGVYANATNPQLLSHAMQSVKSVVGNGNPPATITITPASKLIQDSYLIPAVTGTPDPNLRQVALSQLNFTTPTQAKQITGTGQKQTAGQTASGQLDFVNGSNQDFPLAANTRITAPNGLVVVTDHLIIIPAASLGVSFGHQHGIAHAAQPGVSGNYAAGIMNNMPCCSNSIGVTNEAFTGGQDSQNYTFIQQSDVDAVVSPLKASLLTQAQAGVKAQLKPGEQMVGDVQCGDPNVNVDQHIGSDTGGKSTPPANVSVAQTCKGLAYDQKGALSMVTNLLTTKKATPDLGPGYALVGSVVTTTQVQDQKTNSVTLQITAKGMWAYIFSDAQKRDLMRTVAGKPVSNARTILASQPGVGEVKIDTTGSTLPTDIGQITFSLQDVPGLTASNIQLTPLPNSGNAGNGTNSNNSSGSSSVQGNGLIDSQSTSLKRA